MPETIGALKNNIRETISEIKLLTIDNVLENLTDRVGYCVPAETAIWMKLFSIINRQDCNFK